jgi:ferredoxin
MEGSPMGLKISVDYDLCEANAVCMRVAPEIFEVDDDDNLNLHMEEVPDRLLRKAEEAVRLCPRQALRLEER